MGFAAVTLDLPRAASQEGWMSNVHPGPGTERNRFPPIAEYAFLSDCEVTALVAPSGNVEWLCLPRIDSPSVFAAILDRAAGGFRIGPADVVVPAARRYLPGSLIVETTWKTRTGWLIVRDALCVRRWYHDERRAVGWRRAPSDHQAAHLLLRTVRCVSGRVELALDCEPVLDYGRVPARWSYAGEGYGEAVAAAPGGDLELRLTTSLRVGFEGRGAHAHSQLIEGDNVFVALSWGEHEPPRTWEDASDRMWQTTEYWRQWISRGEFPDHPWQGYLQRSALTLKGLTYAPTGAVSAAPTTSLPEAPGGERNWDYRYTWIRDATFALWGLYILGLDREANDFFYFVADASASEDDLQIMYGIGGERELTESTLDHLAGYQDARPVRVGNAAHRQRQHDVWGAVLDSVWLHTKSRDHLPEYLWPVIKRQVEQAIAHWHEPDQGIWELRGPPQHFTSSKVMCWVACDRGARLARLYDQPDDADRWQKAADEIRADVLAKGLDGRGVFVQHYGTTALDASVLLLPLVRFLPADDERIRRTVLAVAEELSVDGLVLRYRVEQTDDGFAGAEGTFTICSFWLVSALAEIGEVARARQLCEKLLSYASPLGLYAEELDPHTGRHLGNFPQAFTHLAQINAVIHVIRAEDPRATLQFVPPRKPQP
jgi:GH15 family glucan-1,4-alpha-glucosidase